MLTLQYPSLEEELLAGTKYCSVAKDVVKLSTPGVQQLVLIEVQVVYTIVTVQVNTLATVSIGGC